MYKNPTSNSSPLLGDGDWSSPSWAYSDDGSLAYAAFVNADEKLEYATDWGTFGFDSALPSDAVIDAVSVDLKGKNSTAYNLDWGVSAVVSGTEQTKHTTRRNSTSTATWNTDLTADRTWTRANLLNSALKIRVYADRVYTGNCAAQLDVIQLNVSYHINGTCSTTGSATASALGGLAAVGTATVSGTTTCTMVACRLQFGTATVAATATTTVTPYVIRSVPATASASGSTGFNFIPCDLTFGTASAGGIASAAATGRRYAYGVVSVTCIATGSATAAIGTIYTADFTCNGISAASASGMRYAYGSAPVTGVGFPAAIGSRYVSGSASSTGEAQYSLWAIQYYVATASASGESSGSATPQPTEKFCTALVDGVSTAATSAMRLAYGTAILTCGTTATLNPYFIIQPASAETVSGTSSAYATWCVEVPMAVSAVSGISSTSASALAIADAMHNGSVVWANPGNITADDGVVSSASLPLNSGSQVLRARSFGITSGALPDTAELTGFEVTLAGLYCSVPTTGIVILTTLNKSDGTLSQEKRGHYTLSPTAQNLTIGGYRDLWELSVAPSGVRDNLFTVNVYFWNSSPVSAVDVGMDNLNLGVFFKPA